MDLSPAPGGAAGPRRRFVFVTGQLAREGLRRVLDECGGTFDWTIEAPRIKVAALMTTDYLTSTLELPPCDAVYLPGLCQADAGKLASSFGVPFEKGPKDLRDLPEFFGRRTTGYRPDGGHALTILAEINDVHRLGDDAIVAAAERYRLAGADVIDLGCSPEHPLEDAGRIVALLRERGFRVSIDTWNEREALAADAAGAEFLLSLNSQNLSLVPRLRHAVPVIIPDQGEGVASLTRNLEAAKRLGARRAIADPVLDPIHFGFAASLRRYCEAREALPETEMLMGTGNLTELTEADSTGVNAILLGIISELRVGFALTTEVAPWARGAVRELDAGRRMMHHAAARAALPKGFDDRLVTTRDGRLTRPTEGELRAMHSRITDRNFRIETDGEAIYVFNSERFVRDTDIRALFPRLGIEADASHAFYLGRELTKADLARRLGKKYIQGEPLHWGYLTWDEEDGEDHARPAARRRREPAKRAAGR